MCLLLETERNGKKDLMNELSSINCQKSQLLNENNTLNNNIFLINQKLSLNVELYKTLKLNFDELEMR